MGLNDWISRWVGTRSQRSVPVPPEAAAKRDQRRNELGAQTKLGFEWLAKGEHREATRVFEAALDADYECASAHHGLGRAQYELSRFEDAVDSLQLAVHYDPGNGEAYADLALALAQGMLADALVAADRARALGMASARGWEACARAYKALDKLDRAGECYEAACRLDPKSAHYACQRAYVQFLLGQYGEAREGFVRALELDSGHVPALHDLGLLELETGKPASALVKFEAALELHDSPQTRACVAHALRDTGRLDEACAEYERVLAVHPDFGDARANYAQTLLMREDYERGWREYDLRFVSAGASQRQFGLPLWRGESLRGKRLLVFAEQGVGDEIMFASCLPDVLGAADGCIVECDARLAPLFARSFPRATIHGGRKSDDPGWLGGFPRCDFEVPIGSLPRYLRRSSLEFPQCSSYLTADPARVSAWKQKWRAPGVLNVGFAWSGGALRSRQWLRSIPIEQWLDLLRLPACRFVALQHGPQADELRLLPEDVASGVIDLCACSADLDELAAIVAALDLVVSVDNALVHLAGAVGTPTWAVLPESPEWRYPRHGDRMPWYASVRLFRQDGPRNAVPALRAIREALRELPKRSA